MLRYVSEKLNLHMLRGKIRKDLINVKKWRPCVLHTGSTEEKVAGRVICLHSDRNLDGRI